MTHKPTDEQQAIADASTGGQDLVIDAAAGAGKTSTLKLAARANPNRRGVYIAYNRTTAVEAQATFPDTVTCKTAHAFAMAAVGREYRHRLNGSRLPVDETIRILGINEPVFLGEDAPTLFPRQIGRIVFDTVRRFCYSPDREIGAQHLPWINGLKPEARTLLGTHVAPFAQKAWSEDLIRTDGRLRFEHDHYLKLWALTNPQLPGDYVMLDEAQDSNGCVAGVVENQRAQRILVGDACQSIYQWRGAIDAMSTFNGKRLTLSQSFRFGDAVAAEANKWLRILSADLRVSGFDQIQSTVGPVDQPDVVLCRSNAAAVRTIADESDAGRRVAFVGGGDAIIRLAEAAEELKSGRRTSHPELFAFNSWWEVQRYAEEDSAGAELQVAVNLIDKYTPAGVIAIMRRLVDERRADVVVSTAHKAKGREWRTVRIADDFPEPKPKPGKPKPEISRPDAMLAYVAVTRAQQRLDRSGLAWVDNWV